MSQDIVVADVQSHAPRERAVFRGLALILAHPLGRIGAILVGTVVLLALVAPFVTRYDPLAQVLTDRLVPPGADHIFGTDTLGRDVFARVAYGARPSITIVLVALVIIAPFGLFVGAAAGFLGGWISTALMRISDIFMAFPRLILALATAATLGGGFVTLVISIVVTGWPSYARIARAEAVIIARSDFVQASEILGASRLRLLLVHVLPHCVPAMIVRAALDAPAIVLIAAGLGFLGAGLPPPQPEWGAMVADGRSVIFDAWWISTLPGAFILVLSVGFNLIADALRDIIDPRA